VRSIKDLLARLSDRDCHLVENDGVLEVAGQVKNLAPEDIRLLREAKPALLVYALRVKWTDLLSVVDGGAPYEQRLARMPELLATQERLAAAQEVLFASWRKAGFTVVWSSLLEEFLLVGDNPPPSGSDEVVVYRWEEVVALAEAGETRVKQVHSLKRFFKGAVLK
jgi:hypothetical protein